MLSHKCYMLLSFLRMNLPVIHQASTPCERLLTNLASVRLFTRVNPHMSLQVDLLRKPSLADMTAEWLLSCVRHFVIGKMLRMATPIRAEAASAYIPLVLNLRLLHVQLAAQERGLGDLVFEGDALQIGGPCDYHCWQEIRKVGIIHFAQLLSVSLSSTTSTLDHSCTQDAVNSDGLREQCSNCGRLLKI